MIEKITSQLENRKVSCERDWENYHKEGDFRAMLAYQTAIEIVQEVAKEYGNGWIPTEKELPKDSRDVWVTIRTTDGEYYTTDSFYEVNLERWRVSKNATVIAWQPKPIPPAPYQKGE